jgi:hypothetical protein
MLASVVGQLNDLELELVVHQATRWVKGKKAYGSLTDKRLRTHDWSRESFEERLDRNNYDTIDFLRYLKERSLAQ